MRKIKLYNLINKDDGITTFTFESSLAKSEIKKILIESERIFQLPESDYKSCIFSRLMKKSDKKFKILKIKEVFY